MNLRTERASLSEVKNRLESHKRKKEEEQAGSGNKASRNFSVSKYKQKEC